MASVASPAGGAGARRRASLVRRSLTILFGAPVLIGLVWVGSWPLAAVVAVLVVVATGEFALLATSAGLRPSYALWAGALAFPVLAASGLWSHAWAATVALMLASAVFALAPSRRMQAAGSAGADVVGALYIGGLFAYVLLLRNDAGPSVTLTVLAVIWAGDIGAYLVGMSWGRRKLAPAISPGKTIEGFVGGLAAAAVASMVAALFLRWPIAAAGVGGMFVAAVSVAGDLWESAIKRSAGAKDSGTLLPGHGGVLDRFDAVLFGVPVGYYLIRWLL